MMFARLSLPRGLPSCLSTRDPVPGRAKCPYRYLMSAFIAGRATDPPQHLLYLVRDPWPWGKPHEAAGMHRTSRQLGTRVAARGARRAAAEGRSDRLLLASCLGSEPST